MRRLALLIGLLALAVAGAAAAPVSEDTVHDVAAQLRCVVCQSQSVADSDADIAKEVRVIIREQIAAGKSDQDIRDYMVARYGDFVLFDPPFKASTYALWIGPFAILVVAALGVALFFRRRAHEPARARELSVDEHSRVERLLQDGPEDRA